MDVLELFERIYIYMYIYICTQRIGTGNVNKCMELLGDTVD